MKQPHLPTTFAVAAMIGAAIVVALVFFDRRSQADMHPLANDIWISEQVQPESLAALKQQGFRSIIDLRPDGEQAGQPSSTDVNAAAEANGLTFAYVPVPHGDIPDAQVDALGFSLDLAEPRVLLYCRSGRRAARTWALSEASRPDGLDAGQILQALEAAGQSSPDLEPAIASRIAARKPAA